MTNAGFEVIVHQPERIIEVRYPPRPTETNFRAYDAAIRKAIDAMGGAWQCLVDQTALNALAPEFTERIAELNGWARAKGMKSTARVVSESAVGQLQGARILRNSGLQDSGAIFTSRSEAWAFLNRALKPPR